MIDIQSNSTVKISSEKNFGIVFSVFFMLIGIWLFIIGDSSYWAFSVAAIFLLLAFIFPQSLKNPNRLWSNVGILLGSIVAPIVMAMVYVTTIVPIGLLMRLAGKDVLRQKFNTSALSYWIERTDKPQSMKDQF
jgi:hypothetical protein